MRFLIAAAVLLSLGFASPVVMQSEPSAGDEVPGAEPTPDIAATVQVAVAGTVSAILANLPTPTPTAIPALVQPITQAGKGIAKTDLFGLQAGNYAIAWSAKPTTSGSCLQSGRLVSLDQPSFSQALINVVVPAGQTSQGSTNAYNVQAGRYYLDINATCDWSITISPQP